VPQASDREEEKTLIEEETVGGLDFEVLRSAIECGDPDALLGFYSQEAELRIVNANLPDGPAFELKGRSQIERFLHAVCQQRMSCLLDDEVLFGEGSITFTEECSYQEGTIILVRTTLEIADGLIVAQADVVQRQS
jgi:hypothetical protein